MTRLPKQQKVGVPNADTGHYPRRLIIPHLWIGSAADGTDTPWLSKCISLVINCTRHVVSPKNAKDTAFMRIAIDDIESGNATLLANLPLAVVAIDDVLRHGKNVLVHCHAGISRSASVVAGYLMWKRGLTARQAIAFIQRKKPETFYNGPVFIKALEAWQAALAKNSKK